MPFTKWHKKTVSKIPKIDTDLDRYVKISILSTVVFGLSYWYLISMGIGSALNKAVADTSVIFISLSMLLTSLCFFWDFVDTKIVYRKHLGLIGFAYAIVHTALSWEATKKLLDIVAWQNGKVLPVLTASLALFIFTIMALISNNYAARELGGIWWRRILRTGYIGLLLVLAHVALLKMSRWVEWYNTGMARPPALSLIVSALIVVTILGRVLLEIRLLQLRRR